MTLRFQGVRDERVPFSECPLEHPAVNGIELARVKSLGRADDADIAQCDPVADGQIAIGCF